MSKHADFIAKLCQMRELIAQGWTQGFYSRDGCYCLEGAAITSRLPPWDFISPDGRDVNMVLWNDRPERTQTEVLACIDNSIAALESA